MSMAICHNTSELKQATFLTTRTLTGSKFDVINQSTFLTQSFHVTHAVRVVKNVACISSLLAELATHSNDMNNKYQNVRVCNPSEYIYILRSNQERPRKMQHKVLWQELNLVVPVQILKCIYILTWITNSNILILISPSEVQESKSLKSMNNKPFCKVDSFGY